MQYLGLLVALGYGILISPACASNAVAMQVEVEKSVAQHVTADLAAKRAMEDATASHRLACEGIIRDSAEVEARLRRQLQHDANVATEMQAGLRREMQHNADAAAAANLQQQELSEALQKEQVLLSEG